MLEPEELDPDEVLFHLNALGFHNVSPQQLEEFLHDLKRLIKYDRKRLNRSCDECGSIKSPSGGGDFQCCCEGSAGNICKSSTNEIYTGSSSISDCTSTSYQLQSDEKFEESRKPREKDNLPKVPSSFIRPWNVPVHRVISNKSKRNLDPVRLYHQYKLLWNRQKVPGENNHAQLRWIIRNKMLGQEPQPRIT